MTFCRDTPTPLDRIYSVNDLGVLLDPKLKFDCHTMSTVNKAMSVLGQRLKSFATLVVFCFSIAIAFF